MGVILGLAAALLYGGSDFAGGLATAHPPHPETPGTPRTSRTPGTWAAAAAAGAGATAGYPGAASPDGTQPAGPRSLH
jgi:hypothetical protein